MTRPLINPLKMSASGFEPSRANNALNSLLARAGHQLLAPAKIANGPALPFQKSWGPIEKVLAELLR